MSAIDVRLRASTVRVRTLIETPQAPYVVLVALMFLAGFLLLHLGQGTNFGIDDWDFLGRRGYTPDDFLARHNEHLVVVPVIVYKLLFETVGTNSYLPYRIVLLVFDLASAGLLFAYARPRVGPWAALLPATLLLFLGSGWENLLSAFQIGFVGSLAFGLAALIALDYGRDRSAMVLLFLSICSSGLGLPVAAGIAVRLALSSRWRSLWIVAIPVALWFAWDLGYGNHSFLTRDSLLHTPQWSLNAAAAAVAGLGGLSIEWGRVGLIALVVAIALGLRRAGERKPVIVGLLTIVVGFWLLTASGRALNGAPDNSRYVYVGVFWILVLLAELASGLRLTRPQGLAAALVVLVCVVGNMVPLQYGVNYYRSTAQYGPPDSRPNR